MVVDFQHHYVPVELAKKRAYSAKAVSKILRVELRSATTLLACNGLCDARLDVSRLVTAPGFDL